MANKTGAAKTALAHADTRKAALLQDAKNQANTELTKVRRARRTVRYPIRADQKRKLNETGPEVPQPQMPLFMAELHVLGISKAALEDMLVRRKRRVSALPGVVSPAALELEIAWALRMQWKGPDCDPPVSPPPSFHDPHPGGYTLDQEFRSVWTATKLQAVAQTVVIAVGDDDTVKGGSCQRSRSLCRIVSSSATSASSRRSGCGTRLLATKSLSCEKSQRCDQSSTRSASAVGNSSQLPSWRI